MCSHYLSSHHQRIVIITAIINFCLGLRLTLALTLNVMLEKKKPRLDRDFSSAPKAWLSPVKFSIWANFGGRNGVPYPNMVRCHSPYNFHWLIYSPRFFLFFFILWPKLKRFFFWYAYTYRYLLIFKNAFIIATAQAIRTLIAVRQKLFIFYDFWLFELNIFFWLLHGKSQKVISSQFER